MFRYICLALLVAQSLSLRRTREESAVDSNANPIRRVVSMLQAMQKKVQAEGEKEKDLYEKFQCYCKNGAGDLQASISAAEAKGPQVTSNIEEAESKKAQLEQDLTQHQQDRSDAKKAMASATALREKEAAAFAKEKAESDADISAVSKAVAALEKGMAGGFLQTANAQTLRRLTSSRDMAEGDRQEILAFLSGGSDASYAPQSGEITGILKTMGDEMKKSLDAATAAEKEALANYEGLMAAKTKEVQSLTASIESKTERVGELGVAIVQMKNDLDDTTAGLLEDKKFLENLDKNCADKAAEFDERTKTRAEELVALADTIKILNDDDALELFKQTLPSASSSFVQVQRGAAKALVAVNALRAHVKNNPQLDFLALALSGKKVSFDKVLKMIVDMVATLKQEQVDDDNKKEYCTVQLDSMDDKKKGLERRVADEETAVASAEEGIATLAEEIKALAAGIKALDKSVAEATEQRQKENAEFKSLMASDSAAKQLLEYAKNRLNKFYNKALYKPPPKRELSREDRIAVNMGGTAPPTAAPGGIAGTGITVLAQGKADPGPAPETFSGPYQKKSEESTGVIAMIDLLVKDLSKEMTEAETDEKNSQAEYEKTMQDAADKRAQDSKTLTEKTAAKANTEADLQSHKDGKKAAEGELMATHEVISSLHSECDWLLQYAGARKEARAGEISSLENAKAILSGADYSL
jgi:chromosome segregation ATPase